MFLTKEYSENVFSLYVRLKGPLTSDCGRVGRGGVDGGVAGVNLLLSL
jgi:hypothetical protein